MIDEFYYDAMAQTIVELWGEIETELIEEISRRVRATMSVTPSAEFELTKLQQANLLNDRAVELISRKSGLSEREIRKIISRAGFSIVHQDEEIYRRALVSGQLTFEPLPIDMSPSLKTTIESCVANAEFGLSNLTNTRMIDAGNGMETLTKAARREYYNAVNKAFLEVRTGAKTTPQAIRSACTELARSGIRITHWKSGHRDTVEVAVRRNIKTSLTQTAAKMTLARMGDYQHDLVEVSSHFGARPSHFVWQGGIYSLTGAEGYENFYEVTGYGTGAGLCGWNCRHRFYPYFPGIAPVYPQYDEEENRRHYELTQEQRAYERDIRKAKHEKAALEGAGASESDIKAANANIRAKQKALRDFLAENPKLARDYSREQVYDKNGTVKHYGTGVDKSGRSGIIKVGSENVALEYQRYGRNKNTLVNKTYIDSGEYRRKFDNLTDNPDVNKTLYDCAKAALKHRSGTELEDMYWIDSKTGKIVAQEITSTDKRAIVYSDKTRNSVKNNPNLIALHTHPSSMPPSAADFNSCFKNKYSIGFIACHNGKIFRYTSYEEINEKLYDMYIGANINKGLSEYDAQKKAINDLKRNYNIDFWEVL